MSPRPSERIVAALDELREATTAQVAARARVSLGWTHHVLQGMARAGKCRDLGLFAIDGIPGRSRFWGAR